MLAHDESELVRAQLTRNESCPREVVAILALDRSEVVLRAVLNSCKIPANIAHDWMKSQDWTKRAAVAVWKNLSLAEAEELARDEDPRVRYAIQANYHWPKFSRDVIMSKSFEDITRDEVDAAILALHDADVYLKLALVPDREARLLLVKEARNWWHIPDQVVELLSRDADAEVKWEAEQVFSYRESSRNKNIQ
jgi:hypothetical protein